MRRKDGHAMGNFCSAAAEILPSYAGSGPARWTGNSPQSPRRPPIIDPVFGWKRLSIFRPCRDGVEVGEHQQYVAKPQRIAAQLMFCQRWVGFDRNIRNVRMAYQDEAENVAVRLCNDRDPVRTLECPGKEKVGFACGPLKLRFLSSGVLMQQRKAGALRGRKQFAERRLF